MGEIYNIVAKYYMVDITLKFGLCRNPYFS